VGSLGSPARAARRVAAGGLLWLALAAAARAESTAVAGFGVFGAEDGDKHSAVLDLEYRFAPWRWGIGPVVGAAATSNGAAYVRVGLARDVRLGERWNVNLSEAAAGYEPGHGKDLGRGFEFRSAIDVACQFQPGVRVGVALAHLSNAGISNQNPGIETLTVTLSFTPSRMRAER
jgi:hypothetical protein